MTVNLAVAGPLSVGASAILQVTGSVAKDAELGLPDRLRRRRRLGFRYCALHFVLFNIHLLHFPPSTAVRCLCQMPRISGQAIGPTPNSLKFNVSTLRCLYRTLPSPMASTGRDELWPKREGLSMVRHWAHATLCNRTSRGSHRSAHETALGNFSPTLRAIPL